MYLEDIDLIKRIQHYIDYIVTVNDLEKFNFTASRENTMMWKQENSKAYLQDVNEIESRLEDFLVEL